MSHSARLALFALATSTLACADDAARRPLGAACTTSEQCSSGVCHDGSCVDVAPPPGDVLDVTLTPDVSRHATGADLSVSCAWREMPAGPTPAVTLSLDGEPLHQDYLKATGTLHHTFAAPLTGGEHVVLCEVFAASSSAPLTGHASFVVNHPPALGDLTITPDPTVESTLAFEWSVPPSDLDLDPMELDYAWFADDLPITTTSTVLPSYLRKGQRWKLIVTVSDGLDAVTRESDEVVIANSLPVIDSIRILPSAAFTGDELRCDTAPPRDADGDQVTRFFAWYLDASPAASPASQSETLPGNVVRAGQTWRCSATPHDGEARGETFESDPITVLNSAPTRPTSVFLDPPEGTPDTLFTCRYTAPENPDRDGDPVHAVYDWLLDGASLPGGGSQYTFRPDTSPRGTTITCCVALSDGSPSAEVCAEPVVLGNRPPDPGNARVTHDGADEASPDESSALECEPSEFTDPDGDPLDYLATWQVNGVPVAADADGTLSGDAFSEGDVVTCALVASDGQLQTERVASKNDVTIGNAAPRVVAARVVPSPVHSSDLPRCELDIVDPDAHDVHTHACTWTDGDGAALGAGDTLGVSDRPVGSTIVCTCTASDEAATSAPTASAPAPIYNNAPAAPGLRLEPALPRPGDAVTCVVATPAVDPDEDPVTFTYAWTIDGAVRDGLTTASFPPGQLALCDELVCRATPDDSFPSGRGPAGEARAVVSIPETCDGIDTDCDGETDEGLQCGHTVTVALDLPPGASSPRLDGPLGSLVTEDRSSAARFDVTLEGVPTGAHALPIAWTAAATTRRACELLASGSPWLPSALPVVTSDGSPEAVTIHRFDDGSGCAPQIDVGSHTAPGVWTEGPFQLAFSGTTFDPIDHPCAVLVGGFHGWWSGRVVSRSADGDFRVDMNAWGGLPAGTWQFYLYGLDPDECDQDFVVLTADSQTDLSVFPPWLIVPDDMSTVAAAFFELQPEGAGARLSVDGLGHILPAGGLVVPGAPLPRTVLDARCVDGDVRACEAPETGTAMCLAGVWSRCTEQLTGRPEEVFANGLDDDRDGFTDDGANNLVANPGFESGSVSWFFNDSMPKTDVTGANGVGNVTIRQSGSIVGQRAVELNNVQPATIPPAELWHLQAITRIALEAEVPYVLTFRVWASVRMRIGVQIGDPAQDYRSAGLFIASPENPMWAGPQWVTYRVLFVAMKTVADAELSFNAGLDPGTLLVDDVSLERYAP